MSTQDKLADALEHTARHRAATEGIDPDQWRVVLFKWEALALQAHAAEPTQIGADPALSVGGCESVDRNKQMQAAEPVGVLSIEDDDSIPQGKTAVFNYADACLRLPIGYHEIYTHPQPAQDAKDAATIERVARAIYTHVFTMSIPRMGVRTATFDEVWAIPAERERLTAQAHAAIDAAMAKESGR